MPTAHTVTTNTTVASGTSAGGQLTIMLGDNSVFDGARIVVELSYGGVTHTMGRNPGEGEISDLCRGHGTKRWAVVNVPSGVAWAVKSNSVGAATNITLIIGAP